MNTAIGYLEIIIGPMFSGKTSRLIDVYNKYKVCDIPVLVVNYSEDTRYETDVTDATDATNTNGNQLRKMYTHDQNAVECTSCTKLSDLLNSDSLAKEFMDPQSPAAILINEGQFFTDLYETVNDLIHLHNKHVYVCGLDGDYKRNKFGQILDLIPLCDSIYKISAICVQCKNGNPGIFSHKYVHKESNTTGLTSHHDHDHDHAHQCDATDDENNNNNNSTDIEKQKDIGAGEKYIPLCRKCYLQSNE
jgi:thymidine kinase